MIRCTPEVPGRAWWRGGLRLIATAVVTVGAAACRGTQSSGAESPGSQLYAVNCDTCHGPSGKGVGEFPKLIGVADILGGDYARTVITEGRNNMPAFGSTLSPVQIDEIVDHLATFRD